MWGRRAPREIQMWEGRGVGVNEERSEKYKDNLSHFFNGAASGDPQIYK